MINLTDGHTHALFENIAFATVPGVLLFILLLLLIHSITITRKQSEKLTLQAFELELQQRAMDAHTMVNFSDSSGRITYANDLLLHATGYCAEDLIGHTFLEKLTDGPSEDYRNIKAAISKGMPWSGESSIRRKDGSHFWTRTTIMPMVDAKGQLQRTIALRTDITESKAKQAELSSRSMLDRLQDKVYVFTTDTLELAYVNRRALELQGWNPTELPGKWLGDTDDNFDESAFRMRIAPMLRGDVGSINYESTERGVPVDISLQVEECFDGKSRCIAVVRDISMRKRAEQARAEFVATVSHELRSPLTSIKGALRLVTSGAVGAVSEKSNSMLGVALRNVDRLILLINDILDLEKLDADKMEMRLARTDLASLIEDAVLGNAGYGQEFSVTFQTTGTQDPVLLNVDRDRMVQVLTNLLSNAAKFSPKGSVVKVELIETDNWAQISVKDNGIGIPVDEQERVFERFVQAKYNDTLQRNGTGLGLALAKSIVEKHGGTIGLSSRVGFGTTFLVELPKDSRTQQAA